MGQVGIDIAKNTMLMLKSRMCNGGTPIHLMCAMVHSNFPNLLENKTPLE